MYWQQDLETGISWGCNNIKNSDINQNFIIPDSIRHRLSDKQLMMAVLVCKEVLCVGQVILA